MGTTLMVFSFEEKKTETVNMIGLRSLLPTGYRPLPFSCFVSACVCICLPEGLLVIFIHIRLFPCQLKRHQMISVPTWPK